MLTYIQDITNSYNIRTAPISSSVSKLALNLQDMYTLKNEVAVIDTFTYDRCESILSFNLNLTSSATFNMTTAGEWRAYITPSGSNETSAVWHGSMQAFVSQSVDKANYENQIPLDNNEVSHASTNAYDQYIIQ